jgi:hypothetical protein
MKILQKRNYYFYTAIFIATAFLLIQYGCKHDPPAFTDICFESEVMPIFQNNCTASGCHNASDATSDVVLETYDQIIAAGVTAGNAKKSLIYKVLTRGVEAMPPKRKLTGNQIALIYSWIEGGAENTTGCGCDTFDVKYSETIAPILSAHCLSCHGTDSIRNFSNYAVLNSFLDSNSQKLINKINYAAGVTGMPPTGKLDACTIKKITIWINAGHLND